MENIDYICINNYKELGKKVNVCNLLKVFFNKAFDNGKLPEAIGLFSLLSG